MSIKNKMKRMASRLPRSWQNELKRFQFSRQIQAGTFYTDEQEYALLKNWVSEGDWVLDIGANIGHYTLKLSGLVGKSGRVVAIEPVPETFELLAANVVKLPLRNVTLLNLAASDESRLVGLTIPKFDTGLDNYYMAHLVDNDTSLQCMTVAIDSLELPADLKLIKVDVEGHELAVLQGMARLLDRCHPVLIIEDNSAAVADYLVAYGYEPRQLESSSNKIFEVKT